jgi:exo-beta-1,3-glucanase (GH17 family)/cellulose synthase/poly-beta-1,6-N-acetylglucosamine synthase-like glycosyltransferase
MMRIVMVIAVSALVHIGLWRFASPSIEAPDITLPVSGLAFNAYQRWQSPMQNTRPSEEDLRRDLALLATVTPRLRTYSALELPQLPELAEPLGLRITLGAWIDGQTDRDKRELQAAIRAANQYGSIERLIIGNETQLHGNLSPARLKAMLDQARRSVTVPVSTAEPWHVWLSQPDLARHVDVITVHLLPYWENIPLDIALDVAMDRLAQVQSRFPGKPVMIGEIGWPSQGASRGAASASPQAQAFFVRSFVSRASRMQLDYFLMEAIDQPWKQAQEGPVGAYWGWFDAYRHAKFDLHGAIARDADWMGKAMVAVTLSLVILLPILIAFRHFTAGPMTALAVAANAVGAATVLLVTLAMERYLNGTDILVWILLTPAFVIMGFTVMSQTLEFAEVFWPAGLRHRISPQALSRAAPTPRVGIHLACRNEPPDMLIETIDSLLALDWPELDICIVDNNTADPSLWRPVFEHIAAVSQSIPQAQLQRGNAEIELRAAGRRLLFVHVDNLSGFKAGALNLALERTDPDVRWLAVVDADYRVNRDWLRTVAPLLDDADTVIVQSPQAHRLNRASLFERMVHWEYEGFFRIGMHHRHERNAIVQHGTMTLIRQSALRKAGGWNTSCICEDTELGLRLLAAGGKAVYVDHVSGTGLLPADSITYARQRRRWVRGGMQIFRTHAGGLLLGRSGLNRWQRYHFIAGWCPWWGDALHLCFSVAAIVWSLLVLLAPGSTSLPLSQFVYPLGIFLLTRLVLGPLLYLRRVGCGPPDIVASAIAGMGLSHTIAKGVLSGLFARHATFDITRRMPSAASEPDSTPDNRLDIASDSRKQAGPADHRGLIAHLVSVREELALLVGLALCATGFMAVLDSRRDEAQAIVVWTIILIMQALPYLASLILAGASLRAQPRQTIQENPLQSGVHTGHLASPAEPTQLHSSAAGSRHHRHPG